MRDEPVGHVADAGAAVALDGGAQEAQLAHLRQDLAVELLLAVGHQDAVFVFRLWVSKIRTKREKGNVRRSTYMLTATLTAA